MGYVLGKCKTLTLRERVEAQEDILGNRKIEMSESEGGGEQIIWLFLHVWNVCVHMFMCLCMHVEAGVQCLDLQSLSSFFFLYFLRQDLSWKLAPLIWQDQLSSKPQGSSCLSFTSAQITGAGWHTWHFMWMQGIHAQTLCLHGKHSTHEPSPQPNNMTFTIGFLYNCSILLSLLTISYC